MDHFQNGRLKAEQEVTRVMAGLPIKNISVVVVEGEEFYGESTPTAVSKWCRAHSKSSARVTSPGKDAGTWYPTAGGGATRNEFNK